MTLSEHSLCVQYINILYYFRLLGGFDAGEALAQNYNRCIEDHDKTPYIHGFI